MENFVWGVELREFGIQIKIRVLLHRERFGWIQIKFYLLGLITLGVWGFVAVIRV